ncbi:M16 family metallopeptidase [Tsuneonella amylolytica]|uniref:M16 family metallopeptidase n=1 Tax=Tsuneonella amylolytica TaxID=2338327 RepID=UPI000EA94894|nr:insulinase family protein [Tsuneonella amylolytica]
MKSLAILPFLLLSAAPAMAAPPPPETAAAWPFETSDVPVDPAFRFGTLPNGMRYVLRENHLPEGTVLVRLRIGSGSLAETDEERGLAHFLEHMAFNGSKAVPEGEMTKLLEREGLAFGADTNAATSFEWTTYKLDLPRSDPKLVDTALMLMRETAGNLTIDPAAVERERGVILSEKRDRTNWQIKETEDEWAFTAPGARFPERLPIGTDETLRAADAERLRAFYRRTYVPGNAVLVVVGAIDVPAVEAAIRARFADWAPAPVPATPTAGPVDLDRKGETDIYLDPALSERVTASRLSPYREEPDSIAMRRTKLLQQIGYSALNRRFAALARTEDAPYRGAGFGTADLFDAARSTNLIVDALDGQWEKGLATAVREWRRAMEYGFTEAEIAEQVARTRQSAENAAASAETRSNGALVASIEALLGDDLIPSTPESGLARFEEFAPSITPGAVLEALRADAAALDDPLIRFQGRRAPAGGADALRTAWNTAMSESVAAPDRVAAGTFAYTDFGTPGTVVADSVDPRLGIREIRFANGVRLNLKRTGLEKDRIRFAMAIDGGQLLNTRNDPLATAMAGFLPVGGLGKHSEDELQSLLAGRTVSMNFAAADDVFVTGGLTTPADLELQLDLLTAALTDPGYRKEGEARFRRETTTWYRRLRATPRGALNAELGRILSDGDPRFSLAPEAAYAALTYDGLKAAIGDRLARGAIEIGMVGDIDEAAAIALVGKTLGALAERETDFRPREEARERTFTTDRGARTVVHTGEPDQAVLQMVWPTSDDRDFAGLLRLELLERVMRIELTEEIREKLGKAYSPSAANASSGTYRGYGTFTVSSSVDVGDVGATRAAIRAVLERLAAEPVDDDVLDRARKPMLEAYDNMFKTDGGWLRAAARAQTESWQVDRMLTGKAAASAVTAADIQATAARYLKPGDAVEIVALPAPSPPGKSGSPALP